MAPYLSNLRKKLHSEPELSGEEFKTAEKIYSELKNFSPNKIITNLGGTGIAAIFEGKSPGKTILFRAELDALPIQETNQFAHASKNAGVSHKCGHDGHAVILIGLGKILAENRPKKGKVILLFQPAEENGEGAKAVLEDPKFLEIKPDYIFALHNIPGHEKGKILCKPGSFTASVSSVAINLKGFTSHAAEPEHGRNPDLAISELIQSIKAMAVPDVNSADFAVITTIFSHLGSKDYGISAGEGEVHFTIRSWEPAVLEKLKINIESCAATISKKHKLEHSTDWFAEFEANRNDEIAVKFIQEAAKENNFGYSSLSNPYKWGEDFGRFTNQFKGAMFGLGAGENTPVLHNPGYEFPDEIIPYGVKMFHSILKLIHAEFHH